MGEKYDGVRCYWSPIHQAVYLYKNKKKEKEEKKRNNKTDKTNINQQLIMLGTLALETPSRCLIAS